MWLRELMSSFYVDRRKIKNRADVMTRNIDRHHLIHTDTQNLVCVGKNDTGLFVAFPLNAF